MNNKKQGQICYYKCDLKFPRFKKYSWKLFLKTAAHTYHALRLRHPLTEYHVTIRNYEFITDNYTI